MTVDELWERFLAQHEASPARMELLTAMARLSQRAFGACEVEQLDAAQLAQWRTALPAPTRWQATQALAQASAWAARWQLVAVDPLAHVRNARPARREHAPFSSWAQIEAVADALPPTLRLLPWLGAGCGLRPGELLGLCWDCVDLERRELIVRRSVWRGDLRDSLKTLRSRRVVPLRGRVIEQVRRAMPTDVAGSQLVLTAPSGGIVNLHNARARAWRPALAAAGIAHPHRIYDLRHTYATWSLRAGVSIFQLARRMGTSVDMIDATYGHLAADAGEHERDLLDAWDAR